MECEWRVCVSFTDALVLTLFAFYRAMLCISAVYAGMRCPSVRPSVTFVDHVKTNKHIFEIFSPSGSQTILVFPYQTGWRYSDGNPPNGGIECRWVGKKRDSGRIAGCTGQHIPRNADWSISWSFPYQFAPNSHAVMRDRNTGTQPNFQTRAQLVLRWPTGT